MQLAMRQHLLLLPALAAATVVVVPAVAVAVAVFVSGSYFLAAHI